MHRLHLAAGSALSAIRFVLLLGGISGWGIPPGVAVAAGDADRLHVDEAERRAEMNRLAGYGLHGDPVAESPYASPLNSHSYIVPASWFWSAFRQDHSTLSASALRADLPILRQAMQTAYSGWQPAEQAGWNWSQWFADWDQMLAKAGDRKVSFDEAFAPYKQLARFQIDNHSGFQGKGTIRYNSLSRISVLSQTPGGPCTAIRNEQGREWPVNPTDKGQQPHQALVADAHSPVWYIAYPAIRGAVTAVKCGAKWIPAKPAPDLSEQARLRTIETLAGTTNDVPVRRRISPDITYYRLPTFNLRNTKLLQSLLSKEKPSLDRDKLTIVDLRANDGGDAPIEWLDYFTKSPVLKTAGFGQRTLRNSTLYAALRWNAENIGLSGNGSLPESSRHWLQARLDALDQPDAAKNDERQFPPGNWNYAGHHFPTHPKLLILVDNRCGSDGEAMVYLLAAADGAVVAGVNTAGVCQHIIPGYVLLPHTNLPFRMALGMADLYGDGRSLDGYGLDVDVVLPTPEANSPESIIRLAKNLVQIDPAKPK
jgi:Peptidase family S41